MEAIGDQRKYQSCVWMTRELQAACAEKVRDMLHALTMGRPLRYSPCDIEKTGYPFAPHDRWMLTVDEWGVLGETREEAECKMLGLILRDGIGFPLFRNCHSQPKPFGSNPDGM